jgi:UDP-N-acetylmuramoyl-tripeptide--D-alanyl-D-alanine ligase
MVKNALLAAAVGDACGLSCEEIARGLESVILPGARMSIVKKPGEITLINDAYNANPDSMRAGLDALMDFPGSQRRLAVIGSMGELGTHAQKLHEEVGAYAGGLGLAELVFVGPSANYLKAGAESVGVSSKSIHQTENAERTLALLQNLVLPGDTILIKGSHFLGLEKIAELWPSQRKGDA